MHEQSDPGKVKPQLKTKKSRAKPRERMRTSAEILRKLRQLLAIGFLVPLVLFFIDFSGVLPVQWRQLAAIQMVPALLTANGVVLACLAVLALLGGRVYCSIICPLGVTQDCVSHLAVRHGKYSRIRMKTLRRFGGYSPGKRFMRWTICATVALGCAVGFPLFLSLLDPYSLFGRMVTQALRPVYLAGNNLLEQIVSFFGVYVTYHVNIVLPEFIILLLCVVPAALIVLVAWRYGRLYCNTVCPVGTVLGLFGRLSLYKIRLQPERCAKCKLCERVCKSSCIDSARGVIDYSRCVMCMNCLVVCRQGALRFGLPSLFQSHTEKEAKAQDSHHIKTDEEKIPRHRSELMSPTRRLLLGTLIGAGIGAGGIGSVAHAKESVPEPDALPLPLKRRTKAIFPPGGQKAEWFHTRCTACHLCVAKCPAHILQPAITEYGLSGVLQPTLYFDAGFCGYDCTVCTDICPSGALQPLSVEEKHLMQMGSVVFDQTLCIVHTQGTSCGACAEHCPTQGVVMEAFRDGLTIPTIDTEKCIGCGGCEYICPTRPYKAIYVEGKNPHTRRTPPQTEKVQEKTIDSFGF